MDREAWRASIQGVEKSRKRATELNWKLKTCQEEKIPELQVQEELLKSLNMWEKREALYNVKKKKKTTIFLKILRKPRASPPTSSGGSHLLLFALSERESQTRLQDSPLQMGSPAYRSIQSSPSAINKSLPCQEVTSTSATTELARIISKHGKRKMKLETS